MQTLNINLFEGLNPLFIGLTHGQPNNGHCDVRKQSQTPNFLSLAGHAARSPSGAANVMSA